MRYPFISDRLRGFAIVYRFYTDLEESYKMDLVPFLEIDMLNLKDSSINELKKFCKANFDKEKILCALF